MNCTKMLLIMAVYAFLIGNVDTLCNFPSDLRGVWKHSFHGDVNFFLPSVFTMSVHKNKDVEFRCEEKLNHDTYMVVSPFVDIEVLPAVRIPFILAICLQLTKLKEHMYRVVHLTKESSSRATAYARVSVLDYVLQRFVCTSNTTVTRKEYNLLVQDGFINNVKIPCPSAIHGAINFNLNSTMCTGRSDICEEDKSLIQFTSQSCPKNIFYSENNSFVCLYHLIDDKSDVLWIYNMDTVTDQNSTFRYVCLIYEANTTSFQGSQNPRFCDSTQTASSVSTGASSTSIWGTLIEGHFSECAVKTTEQTANSSTIKNTTPEPVPSTDKTDTTELTTSEQSLTTKRTKTTENYNITETTTEAMTTTVMSTQQISTAKEEQTPDISSTDVTTTMTTESTVKETKTQTSEKYSKTSDITTFDFSTTETTKTTKENSITSTEDITTSNPVKSSKEVTDSGSYTKVPGSTAVNAKESREDGTGNGIFTDEMKNIVISASAGVFMILLFVLTLSIVITCIRRGKMRAKKRRSARRRIKNEYRTYMEHIRRNPRTFFVDLNSHRRHPSPIRSLYSRGNSPQRSTYKSSSRSPRRTPSRRSSLRYTTSTPRDHSPEETSTSPIAHAPPEEEIPRISTNYRPRRHRRIVFIDPRVGQNSHFPNGNRDNSTYFNPFSQESFF